LRSEISANEEIEMLSSCVATAAGESLLCPGHVRKVNVMA